MGRDRGYLIRERGSSTSARGLGQLEDFPVADTPIASVAQTFKAPASLFTHPDDTSFLDALDDPLRRIAELQNQGPIIRGQSLNDGRMVKFGDLIFPNLTASPDLVEKGVFAALSWEAARAVYTEPARFSSKANADLTGKLWGPNLSEMDPPEHTKFRSFVQRGFMPKLLAGWQENIIGPVLKRRFDELVPKGQADLVRELNVYFPYEIVGRIVGFELGDIAFVANALHRMQQGFVNPSVAAQASADLKKYASGLIAARVRDPKEDLVSALLQAEVDGDPIDHETFVGIVIHLLQGGIDTVYRMSSTIVQLLLEHPSQFALVKAKRALVPNLVEEALRYEGVAGMLSRQVVADTELMGVHLPKDAIVFVIHPSVNRDSSRWPNANSFDIERPKLAHIAFGNGPHFCIGMHLARYELSKYIEQVLDRLPNLRWAPDLAIKPKVNGWTIRGVNSLPVVWDV